MSERENQIGRVSGLLTKVAEGFQEAKVPFFSFVWSSDGSQEFADLIVTRASKEDVVRISLAFAKSMEKMLKDNGLS